MNLLTHYIINQQRNFLIQLFLLYLSWTRDRASPEASSLATHVHELHPGQNQLLDSYCLLLLLLLQGTKPNNPRDFLQYNFVFPLITFSFLTEREIRTQVFGIINVKLY